MLEARNWLKCFLCYRMRLWRRPGSVVGVATGYGLDGPRIASRWGARFSAPVQTGSGAHPDSCTMGTGSFPGVKSGRGVTLTPHPLLVPWSRKNRAIPVLPLWAVRPVRSLSACTRVHFTFFTLCAYGTVFDCLCMTAVNYVCFLELESGISCQLVILQVVITRWSGSHSWERISKRGSVVEMAESYGVSSCKFLPLESQWITSRTFCSRFLSAWTFFCGTCQYSRNILWASVCVCVCVCVCVWERESFRKSVRFGLWFIMLQL